ncbi:unnamed protein product [Rotaria sp. Silwood2]|nr:unnamed protein product [Rotaria sp. Silwood2]
MNDEFDSTSMINNEKRTSAAKLVNQLYFFLIRYLLNMNDTIKSDDESRISMKYATLACLSYLSTIPYIWLSLLKVLHLLSVREHGDPYLRGACANLLAKLIQTTVHL